MASDFHTYTTKGPFYCEHSGPDIQTPMAFLTAHVKEPDEDDWKKLLRKMACLRDTKDVANSGSRRFKNDAMVHRCIIRSA